MAQGIRVEQRGRVLEITIDRPPANAINAATGREIHAALCRLRDDDALSVGIVTGAGNRIFSAGWDLKEAAAQGSDALLNPEVTPGGFAGMTEFFDLYKPLVAAVNGAAVGGGFEIALACDVIIAAEHAQFWVPDMQRGFLPDAGAVQKLPRRVPYNVAMDMLLTGRRMDAGEARHWGLVREVVPRVVLMDAAREVAEAIAEGAPLALQALKEVLPALAAMPVEEAFAATKPATTRFPVFRRMLASEDAVEGPRAFAEKRKPQWKGR